MNRGLMFKFLHCVMYAADVSPNVVSSAMPPVSASVPPTPRSDAFTPSTPRRVSFTTVSWHKSFESDSTPVSIHTAPQLPVKVQHSDAIPAPLSVCSFCPGRLDADPASTHASNCPRRWASHGKTPTSISPSSVRLTYRASMLPPPSPSVRECRLGSGP